MKKKGKKTYIPRVVMNEIEIIKKQHGIQEQHIAFRKMVDYSVQGRENHNRINYGYNTKVEDIFKEMFKGKRRKK